MACDRFVREGMGVFPLNEEQTAHLAGCGACQAESERHGRMTRLIASLHREGAPPAGWEARLEAVLANAGHRPQWPGKAVVAGLALASAVACFLVWRAPPGPVLTAEVEAAQGVRSTGASVGARYHVHAKRWREVRVWFNDRALVGRCPGGEGCEEGGDGGLTLTVPLSAPGEYRVMALEAGKGERLAEPVSLDEDVRRVRQRHGRFEVLEPLSVY